MWWMSFPWKFGFDINSGAVLCYAMLCHAEQRYIHSDGRMQPANASIGRSHSWSSRPNASGMQCQYRSSVLRSMEFCRISCRTRIRIRSILFAGKDSLTLVLQCLEHRIELTHKYFLLSSPPILPPSPLSSIPSPLLPTPPWSLLWALRKSHTEHSCRQSLFFALLGITVLEVFLRALRDC
jgi:hypothetical protein